MGKGHILLIFIFLSSAKLMSQDIRLSVDSLQNKFTKSITISKFDLSNKKLTINCSFSKKDLSYINFCRNNNIFIGSDNRYYLATSSVITEQSDGINQLTLLFTNYIDTLDQINLFSDCDTCFYFKGIRIYRLYDVIALENGSIIKAHIIEAGVRLIKYKRFGFVNEGALTIPKDQVLCIRYRSQLIKEPDLQGNNDEIQPSSQFDLIEMKNKQEIKSVILEVGTSEVKYKRANFIDGPVFSVFRKDVHIIRYKNGQTDTLNSIEEYRSKQKKTDQLIPYEENTSNYGGHLSIGGSLGGGGLIGVPFRFYLAEQFVLDITVGAKPILGKSNSSYSVAFLNFFFTGGFDIFFTKRFNRFNDKVKMNGIFIIGGGSIGNKYNEDFYAAGWVYEHYKSKEQSFNIHLGAGLIRLHDERNNTYSHIQPYNGSSKIDENLLIFLKLGWNLY